MALERHVVELSARDNLSPILKNVARQAEQTGQTAERANQRAATSSKDWQRAASALGSGLGALTIISTKLANDSEVSQQRLRASIESTGKSYDDYADAIDQAAKSALQLAFDDEDALDALSALTQGTGDAGKALKDLALVEDIARARGIDLASASKIVIAAEQGRITSLKRLGIQIDANATSEEALAALQAKFGGQAESYAQTNAATWERIGNTIENKLEGIGGALVEFQTPILALSTAAAAFGPISSAVSALDLNVKSLASSSFLGPVGLVAALGLAAVAGYKWIQSLEDGQVTAAGVADAVGDLNTSLAELGQAGVGTDILTILASESDAYLTLGTNLDAYNTQLGQVIARENELNLERANTGSIDRIKAIDAELASLEGVRKNLESVIISQQDYNAIQADSIHLLTNLGDLNKNVIIARFQELWQQFDAGQINARELADGIKYLDENSATYGLTLEEIAHQQQAAADAQNKYATSVADTTKQFNMVRPAIVTWYDEVVNATKGLGEFNVEGINSTEVFADNIAASKAMTASLAELAKTLETDFAGAAEAAYNQSVGFTNNIVKSIETTKDWTDAMTGVMGTDFMDDGTWSKLAQLVDSGRLDAEDYTEALKAQEQIYGDLTRAQDASAEIQIKQADALADGTKASADYLEQIAAMPEAEQALTLAWADTDIAGRAQDVADLAAQFGTMSAAQQEAFTNMVESAANTNPALARVLSDLGLIKESTDPSDPGWQISIDNSAASGALSETSEAIGALIEVLAVAYDLNVDAILDDSGFWERYNALPSDKTITVHTVSGDYGYSPFALGGMVPYPEMDTAALGRVSAGRMTLVGEHGPELALLPGGTNIIPNHASRYMSPKGGGGITINGDLHFHGVQDPQGFMRQMRQYESTMVRR